MVDGQEERGKPISDEDIADEPLSIASHRHLSIAVAASHRHPHQIALASYRHSSVDVRICSGGAMDI